MSTPNIRGLTLWRPWAAAIVHGPKRVENRSWAPSKRLIDAGLWIAIHAGFSWDQDGARSAYEAWPAVREVVPHSTCAFESSWPTYWRRQGVVGVARVIEASDVNWIEANDDPWAVGPIVWVLTDITALRQPIPCRGAQGLWTLPPEVLAAVAPLCGGGAP